LLEAAAHWRSQIKEVLNLAARLEALRYRKKKLKGRVEIGLTSTEGLEEIEAQIIETEALLKAWKATETQKEVRRYIDCILGETSRRPKTKKALGNKRSSRAYNHHGER